MKIDYYRKRFSRASGVVWSVRPEKTPKDPLKAVHFTALKLLGRAKFLFFGALDEDSKSNAYAVYVLVRAYFETCMALGHLTIKVLKKKKDEDWEGVWQLAHRIAQGGKYFPSDEYLAEVGKVRVRAINVYDFIDEVDKDISKTANKEGGQTKKPHREVYDTVLSEFGHPNHLGLQISSSLKKFKDGSMQGMVDLNRGSTRADRKNYLIYLDWASLIFFHYWDKLVEVLKSDKLTLPSLK